MHPRPRERTGICDLFNMKNPKILALFGAYLFITLSVVGCSEDKNTPATLEQQKAMAAGRAPTPEELQQAMSKLPKAPAGAPQVPPSGTTPP